MAISAFNPLSSARRSLLPASDTFSGWSSICCCNSSSGIFLHEISTVKQVPFPGSLFTEMSPFIRSTNDFTIRSPRPVPIMPLSEELRSRVNASKIYGTYSESNYVENAKGIYYNYSNKNFAFGCNKGDQIFEIRSYDENLKSLSISDVESYFGKVDYENKTTIGEKVIGYKISKNYKLLLVFDNNILDHYSVFYPEITSNLMADDQGRQW